VQFGNINDGKSPVTLTVTSISGGGFSWTPLNAGEGNFTIACSPPLSSTCD
jgi:hypothetical protein